MKFRTILYLTLPVSLFAEESVSNNDLNRKLDLIIGKVKGLEQRISKLESENILVSKEIEKTEKKAVEADSTTLPRDQIPQGEEERKSFLSKIKFQLKSDEILSRGPWTKKESWDSLKNNLTSFKVRKLLGNPTTIKNSLNPRIDNVYKYTGDLDADGEPEIGIVNFNRDKVVSFVSPF